ncbi:MAG: hypothetical protein WB996_04165, partial [Ignavibacteriaceae bacterium]
MEDSSKNDSKSGSNVPQKPGQNSQNGGNSSPRKSYRKPYYNRRRKYSNKSGNTSGFQRINTKFRKISIVVPLFNE